MKGFGRRTVAAITRTAMIGGTLNSYSMVTLNCGHTVPAVGQKRFVQCAACRFLSRPAASPDPRFIRLAVPKPAGTPNRAARRAAAQASKLQRLQAEREAA